MVSMAKNFSQKWVQVASILFWIKKEKKTSFYIFGKSNMRKGIQIVINPILYEGEAHLYPQPQFPRFFNILPYELCYFYNNKKYRASYVS